MVSTGPHGGGASALLLALLGSGLLMEGAAAGVSRGLLSLRLEDSEQAGLYLPLAVSPTSPCGRALLAMAESLTQDNTSWAAKMVDSWGKTSDGVYFGNYVYGGVYDECVTSGSPDGSVKGKYCGITTGRFLQNSKEGKPVVRQESPQDPWRPVTPWARNILNKGPRSAAGAVETTGVSYGTCIPDICTSEELMESINKVLNPTGGFGYTTSCSVQQPKPEFTDGDIGFLSLVSFLLAVIVCASLVDMYLDYTGNTHLTKGVMRYLLVFSAYTNLAKMFQVNPVSAPGTITCLHGLRVLSMTWVIYSHQQSVYFIRTANVLDVGKYFEGLLPQTILNGFPSVDTFFFLSGLLVAYSVFRETKRTGKFNVVLFFVHRLIRLIPPIGLVAGFVATILRFFVSGHFDYIWTYIWQPMCQRFWWRDVTFVNNFMAPTGDCLGHTWYLAVDTQLYLVAPLIILPLCFYPAVGKAWLFLVTLTSVIIPSVIVYVNNLSLTIVLDGKDYDYLVYNAPWCRAGPWVAGIWLGYILHLQMNTRVKMSVTTVALGWTVAVITGLLVVYGVFNYNNISHPFPADIMTRVVYGGGHRLAWGAALAWVVFACHNGYGGPVNDFISHPVWQPLSRLTYSTYLVAFPVQYVITYSLRTPNYFTHVNKVIETVGALVISLLLAVLVSLMVESPILGLEKLLLRPSSSPSKKAVRTEEQVGLTTKPIPHPDHSFSTASQADSHEPPPAGIYNEAFTQDAEGGEKQRETEFGGK